MELKVRTIKRTATVYFPDESSLSGFFFVAVFAIRHGGNESTLDILMSERPFLPFESTGGKIVLLQKTNILLVAVAKDELTRYVSPSRIPSEIVLISGKTIKGDILNDLPQDRSRLSDYLNHCGAFFPVDCESGMVLVNSGLVKIAYSAR